MQIDDEVKTIGPDRLGGHHEQETFKISMHWKKAGLNLYSDDHLPWYPESSLELVSKPKAAIVLSCEEKERIRKALTNSILKAEDRFAGIEKQLADLQERDKYQVGANDDIRRRLAFLEADHKSRTEDQPQGQTLKVLFGGKRSGKMATFCDELAKFDWNKEGKMLSHIGHLAVIGIDPCGVLRAAQEHEAEEARKKRDETPFQNGSACEPEEIKAGDWAEVRKGESIFTKKYIGNIIHVVSIDKNFATSEHGIHHEIAFLHKLSDAEISRRLNGEQA